MRRIWIGPETLVFQVEAPILSHLDRKTGPQLSFGTNRLYRFAAVRKREKDAQVYWIGERTLV